MPALGLRCDYDAAQLRRLAGRADDADQARRLLAIAAAYDGLSRAEAAMMAGMDRQILRDWVRRFNDEGPVGLVNRRAPGNPRRLTAPQEAEFVQTVRAGPGEAGLAHLARWRCADLKALIHQRWGVAYHERTIGKLLDRLGFSHITTRPRHYRQAPEAMETFKKTSPPSSRRFAPIRRRAHP